MTLLKKSLKDTTYYSLATAGAKIGSFLLIPLINSVLSVDDFGLYDLFLMSSSFIVLIIGFGIDSGFAIIISENKENKELLSFLFTRSLLASTLFLIFLAFLGYIVNLYFALFSVYIFFLLIIYSLSTHINYAIFNFIRWTGDAKKASFISFFSSVLGIALGVLLLFFYEKVITSLFLGMVIGSFLGKIGRAHV